MGTPAEAAARAIAGRSKRIAELAAASRTPAPPPPPPPPAAVQWRHPMQDAWDRRVHDFAKRSGALPPPGPEVVRLYRAGAIPADSAPRSADDVIAGPFGQQMTRAELDAAKGAVHSNPLGAEGRWFTDAADEVDYYLKENDLDPAYYVDVPAEQAMQYRVDKTPFTKNSRNHEREFVLPPEQANRAVRLLDGLAK